MREFSEIRECKKEKSYEISNRLKKLIKAD